MSTESEETQMVKEGFNLQKAELRQQELRLHQKHELNLMIIKAIMIVGCIGIVASTVSKEVIFQALSLMLANPIQLAIVGIIFMCIIGVIKAK